MENLEEEEKRGRSVERRRAKLKKINLPEVDLLSCCTQKSVQRRRA